jgi:hypothetical protein
MWVWRTLKLIYIKPSHGPKSPIKVRTFLLWKWDEKSKIKIFLNIRFSNNVIIFEEWRAPNLLYRLKCESKVKTSEEQKVGACSLVRNTLGVEGHAGVPRWGLWRMTSINDSHGPDTTQTTSWLLHNLSTFGARTNHEQIQIHKTHHGLDLREATTFPLIVYSMPLHDAHIQMAFCSMTMKWESWNSQTWDSHNFGGP